MSCERAIGFDALVAYWLGESTETDEALLEEHLFACAHCSRRLEGMAALAFGVREAVRDGGIGMVVSEAFVATMKRAGLRLREYRLDAGGRVNCTIRDDDDAVVSRLRAPLADVERLDVVRTRVGDEGEQRMADVPFDAETGEVLIVPSPSWLKSMPAFTMRMRLVSVGDAGEKAIAEYTFNHSPS